MNPQYKVLISVTLTHPIDAKSTEMQLVMYLPFVPHDDQVVRLTDESGEDKLDVTLGNVVYDSTDHMFVCSMQDDGQIETYRENGTCNTADLVAQYQAFGFTRMNYPAGQVIRNGA